MSCPQPSDVVQSLQLFDVCLCLFDATAAALGCRAYRHANSCLGCPSAGVLYVVLSVLLYAESCRFVSVLSAESSFFSCHHLFDVEAPTLTLVFCFLSSASLLSASRTRITMCNTQTETHNRRRDTNRTTLQMPCQPPCSPCWSKQRSTKCRRFRLLLIPKQKPDFLNVLISCLFLDLVPRPAFSLLCLSPLSPCVFRCGSRV